ncbi:hypothetical protein K3X06_14905, partial [Listeria monocytogenes]|nr:hypothetical protein [Listeria monocytogenes]
PPSLVDATWSARRAPGQELINRRKARHDALREAFFAPYPQAVPHALWKSADARRVAGTASGRACPKVR